MSAVSDIKSSTQDCTSEFECVISVTESTPGTEDKSDPVTHTLFGDAVSKYIDSDKRVMYEVPKMQEGFSFEDGDACILAGNTLVATHKYLLKRFKKLGERMKDNVLVLGPEDHDIMDFRDTLGILYTSVVDESSNIKPQTLTSALRLATTYEYPALRAFAIKRLEVANLSAINRIQLAREFNLPSWEETAYTQLRDRDAPITMSEASVLGLEAFVLVARIREKEQRRRGRVIDAVVGVNRDESDIDECGIYWGEPSVRAPLIITPANPYLASCKPQKMQEEKNASVVAPESLPKNTGASEPQANQDQEAGAQEDEKKAVEALTTPCLVNSPIPDIHDRSGVKSNITAIQLPVANCTCNPGPGQTVGGQVYIGREFPCKFPPGAIRASVNLQTEHVPQANSIPEPEAATTQTQTLPMPPILEHPPLFVSPRSDTTESVRGGVLRWLDSCKNQIDCE